MASLATSSPAVLVAHVAARTTSLRVGSGGVMLPNYAPLAVVEQFGMLEELHPGRIDLGLGRSSGADQITSHALRRTDEDYARLLAELLAFFRGEFPDGHPYGRVAAVPGQGAMPKIWLLGVLIHGAAGGVGSIAVHFAKSGGLLVAATCGTANVAYVRSLGADRVIDYKTENACQAVRGWSAEGVDVVLDAVGPATLPQVLEMLRPGGRLVNILIATADGDIESDRQEAERRSFRKIVFLIDFDRAQESMRAITNLIDRGLVHVPPIEFLPLEDAARAHQMIETGHVRGKLVLKVTELPLE